MSRVLTATAVAGMMLVCLRLTDAPPHIPAPIVAAAVCGWFGIGWDAHGQAMAWWRHRKERP